MEAYEHVQDHILSSLGVPAEVLCGDAIRSAIYSRFAVSMQLFNDAIERVKRGVAEIGAVILKSFSATWRAFEGAFERLAAATYLKYHRRLPGSDRTARLRKKRRTKVMRWFGSFLESAVECGSVAMGEGRSRVFAEVPNLSA